MHLAKLWPLSLAVRLAAYSGQLTILNSFSRQVEQSIGGNFAGRTVFQFCSIGRFARVAGETR
jgi:hypothetical protein